MAYFSNGSEGEILDNQCAECRIPQDVPCPVLYVQMAYNYDQLDEDGEETLTSEVMNCLVDKKGICKMKPILDSLKKA